MTTIEINTTVGLAAVIEGPNSTTFVHPETMRATCGFDAKTGIGHRTVVWGPPMTLEGWA